MEYLTKIMKKSGLGALFVSIIFAIVGTVLIVNPGGTIKTVAYTLGTIFIMIGISKVIRYARNKGECDFFHFDITFGIISIIIGLVTIIYIKQIGTIFRIIIGIWIIHSAIMRLNTAMILKEINSRMWISSLSLAILMFACGLYILFTPNAILVTIGIIILVYSILDIMENIIFLINIKNIMN